MPPGEYERMERTSRPVPPMVDVDVRSRYAAIVTLSGEHDLHSKPELARALARAIDHPGVLVDLTDCTFIESSAIAALVSASRAMAERNGRLELVIPAAATGVSRIMGMAAIGSVVAIHETRSAGEASIHPREDFAGDAVSAPAAVSLSGSRGRPA